MKFRSFRRYVLVVCCILFFGSCAITSDSGIFDVKGPIWPESPEVGRVAFVAEFSSARDLGIRESVWEALVSVVAGEKNFAHVRPMASAVPRSG